MTPRRAAGGRPAGARRAHDIERRVVRVAAGGDPAAAKPHPARARNITQRDVRGNAKERGLDTRHAETPGKGAPPRAQQGATRASVPLAVMRRTRSARAPMRAGRHRGASTIIRSKGNSSNVAV